MQAVHNAPQTSHDARHDHPILLPLLGVIISALLIGLLTQSLGTPSAHESHATVLPFGG